MSVVYTKSFICASPASGYTTVAPANGKVWILKNATIVAGSAVNGDRGWLSVGNPEVLFQPFAFVTGGSPTLNWSGRIALEAGEPLNVRVITGSWFVIVTGYEFDGP